jgi:hypothetical protein
MTSSMTKEMTSMMRGDRGGAGVVELLQPDDDQQRRDLGDVGMLPAMKMTEPYSPTARAKASAKPVRMAGAGPAGSPQDRLQRLAPSVAAASSTSRSILQHRLHGAHHEGQADEDQRDDDAERRVGDLDAERREQLPIQPFGA